jgi:hydroxymethylpyrimidine pyrophosphatase-like HAD family hydrolase
MLKEKYGDTFTFAVSGTAVEITAKNVNKGNTLLEYCQLNGISKDEVIVCGDSGNDIPMFERFPHSFAMAQSPDYVINRANHIINKVCDVEKYILDESLLANDSVKLD